MQWDENEANLESGSPTPDEMGGGSSEGSEADGNLVTLVYLTEGLDIRLASLQIKEEDSAWREMEQELIDIIIPKLNEPEVDGRLRIATLGEFVATQKAAFANLPLAKHHSSLRVFLEARDDHFACVGDFAMTIERSKREENMLEEKKNFQVRAVPPSAAAGRRSSLVVVTVVVFNFDCPLASCSCRRGNGTMLPKPGRISGTQTRRAWQRRKRPRGGLMSRGKLLWASCS